MARARGLSKKGPLRVFLPNPSHLERFFEFAGHIPKKRRKGASAIQIVEQISPKWAFLNEINNLYKNDPQREN